MNLEHVFGLISIRNDNCVSSLLRFFNNRINSPFNCRMFSESSNRRNLNLTTWLKQPKVYGSHQLSSKYQLKVKVSVLSDLVPASPWYPHYLGFSPLSDNFYTARLPEWGHKVIFSFYLTSHYTICSYFSSESI